MNDLFSPSVAASLPDPARRQAAAERAQQAGWPSTETEEWRYSPVNDLGLDDLTPAPAAPSNGTSIPDSASMAGFGDALAASEWAATVTVVDGFVVDITLAPGWADKGLEITSVASAGATLAGEATRFDHLHDAFGPATLMVRTPTGLSVRNPIVIRNHHALEGGASFPHVVIDVGDGSDLSVVEHQTSAPGSGLSVPVVELRVAASARLRYQVVQDHDRQHVQIGRQVSSVEGQATLTSAIAAFGGRYARLRTDSALVGRGASAELVAAYYGDGDQIHDFRTYQHHHARNTRSDLLFKGAQDGSSGSVYTGLIHIHPDGGGSNAFQTNRNVKLSPDAWAWSVPNLEIENNDVHCSHASTVSPVDEDQQFYLQARGVPPAAADQLIVAGFFDEVIERSAVPAVRPEIRRQIAAKLERRGPQR